MGMCRIWFTIKIIFVSFDSYSIFFLDPLIISIACPSSSCLCTHFYIFSVHKIIFYAILFLCRTTNSTSPSSSSKPYQKIFAILECFSINLSTREDVNFVVLLPTTWCFLLLYYIVLSILLRAIAESSNIGVIVGAVVGGLVLCGLILLGLFYGRKYVRNHTSKPNSEKDQHSGSNCRPL